MSAHVFYVLLHPLGAGLFHMLGHVPIDIQCKCRRSVAQVSLHRFHIVAVLERQYGISMPEIMHPGLGSAYGSRQFFKMVVDGLGMEMPAKLIGKHNGGLPLLFRFPALPQTSRQQFILRLFLLPLL